jgi:HemY protein
MLRLIGFLLGVALIAAGLAWLADRPGELIVQWQGYQIETSVFRAIVMLVALIVAALAGWSLMRHAWNSPAAVGNLMAKRRQRLGIDALSSGMIALGAGDRAAAMRAAIQARKSLPNEPLTHLLRAQAAQLSGDRTTARRIFEAMLATPDTEQLGLRGLYLEAQREGETEAARHFTERAVALNPKLAWAVDALFDLQCRQSDWAGALETLSVAKKHGHAERAKADRRRAVLLTAQAQAAEENDPERALTLALEAHGLAADLVPAAAIAGRLLASRGNTPRAAKILQRTWARAPHPDLATAYAYARIGDSPRDRLDRVKQLAALSPNSPEGPIAEATAAIEARQYDAARAALEPLLAGRLTQRVATLMARIEGEQHGDKGRVREWLARAVNAPRDPAWTADGVVADRWAPISPVTGALDAFQWRVPVETMDRGDGELLAAKLEELVALGGPEGESKTDEAAAARKKVEEATTIEVVPITEPKPARPEPKPARPQAPKTEPVVEGHKPETAPAARQSAAPVSAPPPASEREKKRSEPVSEKRRKPEAHIFVAPHAPDDPGPETGGQDDIGPPLRPKPA